MTEPSQDNRLPEYADDQWHACSAGEIQHLAQRARSHRSTQKLTRALSATSIVAVVLIAVFVGGRYWLNQQMGAPGPGAIPRILASIGCEDVVAYLPAYVNDTLHRDHPKVYSAVFVHLQHCPHCDAKKKQLQSSQTTLGAVDTRLVLVRRDAPTLFAQQRR